MTLTQSQMLDLYSDKITKEGKIFSKKGGVFARPAIDGEIIITIINNEVETKNIAKTGDYIISNNTSQSEQYILTKEKFLNRYTELVETNKKLKTGYKYYTSTGKCIALKMNTIKSQITFIASWGESMICNSGDYLVMPINHDQIIFEIYRIEKNAFFETYE